MAQAAGFLENELVHFTNVEDCLDHLRGLAGAGDFDEWPSHIFLDLNMPMKSGYDFVDEFAQFVPAGLIPEIFLVSSTRNPTDIERVAGIEMIKGFLTKFLEQSYFEELQRALHSKMPIARSA